MIQLQSHIGVFGGILADFGNLDVAHRNLVLALANQFFDVNRFVIQPFLREVVHVMPALGIENKRANHRVEKYVFDFHAVVLHHHVIIFQILSRLSDLFAFKQRLYFFNNEIHFKPFAFVRFILTEQIRVYFLIARVFTADRNVESLIFAVSERHTDELSVNRINSCCFRVERYNLLAREFLHQFHEFIVCINREILVLHVVNSLQVLFFRRYHILDLRAFDGNLQRALFRFLRLSPFLFRKIKTRAEFSRKGFHPEFFEPKSERLFIRLLPDEVMEIRIHRNGDVNRNEMPRQVRVFPVVKEHLFKFRFCYLFDVLIDRIYRAVFLYERYRGLFPDSFNAGNVVRGISH